MSTYLNINGIYYKSSKTKLQKALVQSQPQKSSSTLPFSSHRRLIVRGESFLLDASGKNLIRIQNTNKSIAPERTIERIDIGKITFVRKSNNTYERTNYHKNRFHLNAAKQRSINLLTNSLVKSNVPCMIYRKLGKCAAYERSKCSKLHDPKQVDICQKLVFEIVIICNAVKLNIWFYIDF